MLASVGLANNVDAYRFGTLEKRPIRKYECPASKPEYLKRYEFPDKGLVEKLRLYGSTQPNGQMGDDCRIPKNVLLQAADRIEVLSGVRAASS